MTYFDELSQVLSRVDPSPMLDFVRGCEGTLWLAGNGGSMSTAQHWACDLSKAAGRRVQSLGSNPAVLTAWANDTSYGAALAAELLALAQPRDRVICLSCSGTSTNIETLMAQAWLTKLPCALVTGRAHVWPAKVGLVVAIPHDDYGILEDTMSAIGHWLTKELQR